MDIKEIMSDDVIVIKDTDQLAYARNIMLKKGLSSIVVVDSEDKPVGIITERDITHKLNKKSPAWRRRPIDKILVNRIMNEDLITIQSKQNAKEAADLMLKNNIGTLPVVDNNELVGIVTKTDLLKVYEKKYKGRWAVEDLMNEGIVTVDENHAISHVISLMEEKNIGRTVVTREGELVGIITAQNISFAQIEDPETGVNREKIYFIRNVDETESKRNVRMISLVTAGDIMSGNLITIDHGEDAALAANLMLAEDISGIPVIDNDDVIGIITKTDIMKGIQ
jgi:CBS domain-containing protein